MSELEREDALDCALSGQTQNERLIDSVSAVLCGNAYDLKLSHTIDGEWSESEQAAKAEHDMLIAMAGELRKLKQAVRELDGGDALSDVAAERKRQDEKWGGPEHDDRKSPNDFVQHVQDYAGWARVMAGMGGTEGANKYRKRMVQVAALAVAAVEAMDRAMTSSAPPEQESE